MKKYSRNNNIDTLMNEMMNFGSMGKMDRMMDNFFQDDDDDFFNDMRGFSDFGNNKKNKKKKNEVGLFGNNMNGGNYYSKQIIISSHQGKDGKMHQKKYVDNQYNIVGKNGKRFGERNQMYNDSEKNTNKLTQDKYYNNQGVRVKKSKIGNDLIEERVFKGMDEDEYDNFKNNWNKKSNKYHNKYLDGYKNSNKPRRLN